MSGSYLGFSASLKVDVNVFKESMSKNTRFGEHKVVFKSGGPNLPEPIGIKLVPITEAFDPAFYSVLDGINGRPHDAFILILYSKRARRRS